MLRYKNWRRREDKKHPKMSQWQNQNWKAASLLSNFKYQNSKDRYHDTNNSPLPHLISAKGLCWGKLPKHPMLAPHAATTWQRKIASYCQAIWSFFLLPWNGKIQDPLHLHILVNASSNISFLHSYTTLICEFYQHPNRSLFWIFLSSY